MANKKFEVYFDERLPLSGSPPPEGDRYLVLRSDVVYSTTFAATTGYAASTDDSDVTTFAAADTWTPIANTLDNVVVTPSLVFAANEFTYTGLSQTSPTRIRAACSGYKVDPNPVPYSVGILINAVPVTYHMVFECSDTEYGYGSTEFYYNLQSGDVISMAIENRTNTESIILQDVQFSIG